MEAKKTQAEQIQAPVQQDRLVRLPEVLKIIPVKKSTWWDGVRDGRYPRGIKLSPRTTAWKLSEIYSLIDRLDAESRA
ncbi:MAG: AlpA family phage regulatory protein [Desulfovibrionales bacterium]|nr:AlpA family phage regulatory protein [Desulfovibrionales bacterium]